MNQSCKYWLLQEILRELRDDSTFVPTDVDTQEMRQIEKTSIIFRKLVQPKPETEGICQETMPGLIVTTPRSTTQEITKGENARDWWTHRFMIQIIDGDRSPSDRYSTYWKWQEQMVELFNFQNLKQSLPRELGCIFHVLVTMIDDVDEKMWVKHPRFVSGVEIEVTVLKNRPIGS